MPVSIIVNLQSFVIWFQIESFRQDRKREIYRHMSKIKEGKKAKKQKVLEERRKAGEKIAQEEETEEEFNVEQISIPAIAEDNSMVQIFTGNNKFMYILWLCELMFASEMMGWISYWNE